MIDATTSCSKLALEVEGLSYSYPESTAPAVKELSVKVAVNELVAIVGASGCGKSTFLSILAGLIVPDAGSINWGEQGSGQQGSVGFVQQRDTLLPWRTAMGNVLLGLEIRGEKRSGAELKVLEHATYFGVKDILNKRAWELSGGMRQRISLLRTVLLTPSLLLLDEPFGALDAINRDRMHHWLAATLKRYKMTTILVTHDIDEALKLADRVLIMSKSAAEPLREVTALKPQPGSSSQTEELAETKRQIRALLAEDVEEYA